ncbi:hypothetical protein BDZ89DRAFT_946302 [Hymenopellis radicata]|nr:hypothetical protein BDZ89DRAFT_946302 [Hymenopellis radicata]
MEFVQGLDPSKLVLAGTVLSFVIAPFAAPTYNLPIFLFGSYAQENTEAVASLQTFTGLVGGSLLWDIIWMSTNEQNGFIKFLTILLFFVKIPTFLAFGLAARQRGAQFGGLGIRGGDLSVWSMPGGFTSTGRDGYQNMDEEQAVAPPPPRAPVHVQPAQPQPPAKSPPPPGSGPYQTA